MIDRKIGDKPISFEFSLGEIHAVTLPWKVTEHIRVPPLVFFLSGTYGNIFEPAAQTSVISLSPSAIRSRKMPSPEASSKFSTLPSSPGPGPASPLLPREAQEAPVTSRSTTTPLKPNIVEGNRLSHVAACSEVGHFLLYTYILDLDAFLGTSCTSRWRSRSLASTS